MQSPRIRDHARRTGLPLTAYRPLAKGRVSRDSVLTGIAARHHVSAPAIALAFLMQEGHIVIPSSASETRLRENLAARDIVLSEADMTAIRRLDRGDRMIDPAKSPKWDDGGRQPMMNAASAAPGQ